MGGLLIEGMQDGSIRVLDQSVTAQYLLQAINAAVELHRWVRHIDLRTVHAVYVRPVLQGVRSPSAARELGTDGVRVPSPADPNDRLERTGRAGRRMPAARIADART